jgi:hypothetical protein
VAILNAVLLGQSYFLEEIMLESCCHFSFTFDFYGRNRLKSEKSMFLSLINDSFQGQFDQ